MVLRELGVQLLRRIRPAADAAPVIVGLGVLEEGRRRFDEPALARIGRAQGARLADLVPAERALREIRARRPQRLEQRHRHAPVGHGALGILRGDLAEPGARLRIGHVVEEGERAVEVGAHGRRAMHAEVRGPAVAGMRVARAGLADENA